MNTLRVINAMSAVFSAGIMLSLTSALSSAQAVTPSASGNETSVVLSPFVVTTISEDGYSSTESATASRFKQQLKDIPQSISILSNQFLKDIAAVDLVDVMPMLGATVTAGTRQQNTFAIRGFAVSETYVDGMRDVQEWGGGDFVHVQQVEVIKGPSSNLYANPKGLGGIINRVSKLPLDRQWQQVSFGVGNYDNYHFTADVTGPITANKSLLYRVNAAYRNAGSYRDFKDMNRLFIAPVVEWRVSPATKISFFGEFHREDYQEDNWIPSVLNTATGQRELTVPISRRIDEPWANSRVEREKVRLIGEHKINENLTARVAAQQTYINNPIEQVEFLSLAADSRTVNRRAFWLNRWEDYTFVEANLFGQYRTGEIEHSFILAADTFQTTFRSNVRRVPLGTIDLLSPTYNTPKPAFPASAVVTNTLGDLETSGYSGTYQLNAYDGRVILVGGWRKSEVDSSRRVEIGSGPYPLVTDPTTKADSPRYGGIIRPLPNLAFYYQYSETFQPQSGGALRLNGTPLDPVTGSSEELGLRFTHLDERLSFELVKYEIKADGLAVRLAPPNNSFFENGGQTTADGYEYSMMYSDRNLYVSAGWVTVKVRDTTPGSLGLQVAGQPKTRGHLQFRYRWTDVGSHGGLSLGGGLVHTGNRPLTVTQGTQEIPSYATYNLNANYMLREGLNIALSISNLFDKQTIIANNNIMWRPLDPRIMRLTLTKSW